MQNGTQRIIAYCRSTVKIVTVSYRNYLIFDFCEIEQEKLHYVIFSIDLKLFYYFIYGLY